MRTSKCATDQTPTTEVTSGPTTWATMQVAVRHATSPGWMVRRASDAYLAIDGVEQPVPWHESVVVSVPPGTHQVSVFAQPRSALGRLGGRLAGRGGRGTLRVTVGARDCVAVLASLSADTGEAFHLRIVDRL